MDTESRLALIKSEPLEEIVTGDEMKALLETKEHPVHYIGFEISGMPHIGHILVAGKKINDLDKAGIKTNILLADWHTVANNKLGGDWDRITKVAGFYRKLFGIVCPNTKVVLGSDLYRGNDEYWKLVIRMASRVTMARATRTLIIQGRSEKDALHVSQYIYPIMQALDIHALGVDIPHAGMDQRRVHMLAKELFHEMQLGSIVPIHHHLLAGLAEPPKVAEGTEKEEVVAAMKMSKSKPGSAISVLATDEEIQSIMKHAWCPEGGIEDNPVLELCKYVLFPINGRLRVRRSEKYGGEIEFASYRELEEAFAGRKLHPMDLKAGVGESISELLEPVRRQLHGDKEEIARLIG